MTTDEYNGWTNRETWAFHLWLTNDQPSSDWARSIVNENTGYEAESKLKDFLGDTWDRLVSGEEMTKEQRLMLSDIGSLWRINYREIVEAFAPSGQN